MVIFKKRIFILVLFMLLFCTYLVRADSGGYIVKFNTDISFLCNTASFEEIGNGKNIYKIDSFDVLKGFEQYVEYCEVNDKVELIGETENISLLELPSDELYSQQWNMQMVNIDYAWDFETYGNQINIAVIDSGCNAHKDLKKNLVGGCNLTDTSKFNDFSDNIGHGTHVAGIIAAEMNDIGVVGAAPKANIYAIKCVDRYHSTGVDVLADAIYAAVDDYNCRIINMSLGTKYDKAVIREAVKYAYDRGVIITAAVGNDGDSEIYYPAGYDEVIGVGSVGIEKKRSNFSQDNDSVFVVAPGEQIKSLVGTSGYKLMTGTSQAAPLVAGAAAIVVSAADNITPYDFQHLLKNTSMDLGEKGMDTLYGWGLLNVRELMKAVIEDYYVSPNNEGEILIYNNTDKVINAVGILGDFADNIYVGGETRDVILMPKKKIKLKFCDYENETFFFLWQSLGNLKPMTKRRIGGK